MRNLIVVLVLILLVPLGVRAASDDFNRADGPLGSNWDVLKTSEVCAISSNHAVNDWYGSGAYWVGSSLTANVDTSFCMETTDSGTVVIGGLVARYTDDNNYIYCDAKRLSGARRWNFGVVVGGAYDSSDNNDYDVCWCRVTVNSNGGGTSTITWYTSADGSAWTQRRQVTNSTIGTSTKHGFQFYNVAYTSAYVDNWSATDIGGGGGGATLSNHNWARIKVMR